jgi:Cof subfamily protein (haloacid dehalogenase superfamily)
MNYRILAVDMDGTVLNSEKKISPPTDAAIHRALEEGYQVLFCTGRNLIEVQSYLDLFPEMRYVILCSGGVVKDLQTGANLHHRTLDYDLAKQVIREAEGMDVNIIYFIGDQLYADRKVRGKMEYYNCQCFHELYESYATWMDDPASMMDAMPDSIRKINLFFHDREEYLKMGERLDAMGVNHPSGIPNNYEISPAGVSKAVGLQVLCDHLGIRVEQSIACGDEGNDYDMIQAAGLGVAMGNAIEPIKAIADTVVADCDHDGVAEAIELYLGKPVLKKEN